VKRQSWLRHSRRAVQLVCLLGVLLLFVATEYRGLDEIPWPVGLLFRLDPLALLADLFAPGAPHWQLLWPALLVLAATALLGRFFCGWVCPLGTTLDGCGSLLGRGRKPLRLGWRRVKYLLLLALVVAALLGVQWFGLFDPLAIFLRTLTLALYPAYNLAANALFDVAWQQPLPLISPALNSVYPFWRDHLMAFHQPVFTLSLFTLLVFLGIAVLERIERRFWCKNLCPLGALLGLCSGAALVRRRPGGLCADCQQCSSDCRMDAVAADGLRKGECILCFDCADYCPDARVQFGWASRPPRDAGVDLSRRGVVGALAAGVLLAPVVRIAPAAERDNPFLIRPPGAVEEREFLRRCIRCGECMKVCIGSALHPAFHQAGASGLWTPLLMARLGYCEYNCTLCGQVCPTGAIKRLPVAEKRKVVIGLAVFDKNRCLPYARGEECLVCEEHCPTGEKAIVFEEREVTFQGHTRRLKVPTVVSKRCIGCGICETKCPLDGTSAIRIVNEGESRKVRSGAAGGYGTG
jgi:MauM/NapG family ferredoxin protein